MKWLITVMLLANLGCASMANQQPQPKLPNSPLTAMRSHYLAPARNGLLLRHSVRLRIPGRSVDQTFNGIMRFDHDGQAIRLVGMAGFGMKLFDLSINQDAVETHFISPGLSRINNLPEHIAFCVRRIWLTHQPGTGNEFRQVEGASHMYRIHDGQHIEHEYLNETLTTTRSLGPREYWEIQYSERMTDTREPSRIIFKDGHERYLLDVRLIEQRMTSS